MSESQNLWQDNLVKGEKYIYNETDTIKNIILGSSLASRIVVDSLSHFYNLSFAGQGFFDGLEILKHKKNIPKNIFIEINSIFSEENKEFIVSLFSPLPFNVKKYCLSLRSDKQPLAFIFPAIQRILHKNNNHTTYDLNISKTDIEENKNFNKLLELQVNNYSKIPNIDTVNNIFLLLEKCVSDLKIKGSNVIFFEMPVNPDLIELPLSKFIRNKFFEHFPSNQYNYIKSPDCSNYVTTDGVHLNDREAIVYTSYFKAETNIYSLK